MTNWYESKESDSSPIISSRIRLARNLAAYPFPVRLSTDSAMALINEVRAAAPNFHFVEPAKEDVITRLSMVERHYISPEVLKFSSDKSFALLIGNTHSGTCSDKSIMLGEEDHIRIQAVSVGNNLDNAYAAASEIDDFLESSLEYAYHEKFGYLTSCPTNTGTGLRASFMMHIPMLEKTGNLTKLISNLSKLGMTVRGIYGEGSKSFGGIYQVSNQVTLGKSEDEIINELKTIGNQLVDSELSLLQNSFTKSHIDMEDVIFRALGLLTHARRLTVSESMESLSAIRIGLLSGILKKDIAKAPIYCIMMNILPGNLQKMSGGYLSEKDILTYRARYLREMFK